MTVESGSRSLVCGPHPIDMCPAEVTRIAIRHVEPSLRPEVSAAGYRLNRYRIARQTMVYPSSSQVTAAWTAACG